MSDSKRIHCIYGQVITLLDLLHDVWFHEHQSDPHESLETQGPRVIAQLEKPLLRVSYYMRNGRVRDRYIDVVKAHDHRAVRKALVYLSKSCDSYINGPFDC